MLSWLKILDYDTNMHDFQANEGALKDKVILITGAGGSVGSELSRQIKKLSV